MANELADSIPDLLFMPYQEVTASFNRDRPAAGDTLGNQLRAGIGRRGIVLRIINQDRRQQDQRLFRILKYSDLWLRVTFNRYNPGSRLSRSRIIR